jgi:hypothetical protein
MSDPTLIGTVAGLTVASWGTKGAGGTDGVHSLGLIKSARRRKDGEEKKVKNPSGNTMAHLFYDDRQEVEMEVLALDAAALPNRGDSIDIAGVTAVVTTCEENWQEEDFRMITVSAVKHVDVALS